MSRRLTGPLEAAPALASPGASARVLREAALVTTGAAAVGASAQVAFPLPGTPVPVTLQTLAVLLVGAGLGWARGGAAVVLYVAAGFAGMPWFAGHTAGVPAASAGYLLGAIPAAALVGLLRSRGLLRSPLPRAGAFLLAQALVYAVGVPVLMATTGTGLAEGIALGLVPFVVGDLLKVALATLAAPAAARWSPTPSPR